MRKANWKRCSFINPFTTSHFQFCISRMGEWPRWHTGAWVVHVVCLKKSQKQALYPQRLQESQNGLHKRSDLFTCSNTGIEMAVLFADRKTLPNVTYYKQNAFVNSPTHLLNIHLCVLRKAGKWFVNYSPALTEFTPTSSVPVCRFPLLCWDPRGPS